MNDDGLGIINWRQTVPNPPSDRITVNVEECGNGFHSVTSLGLDKARVIRALH